MKYHVVEHIESFDDLECVEVEILSESLHHIENCILQRAMSGAVPSARAAILSALTKRGAALLIENVALIGPLAHSEVEAAQRQLVAVVNLILRSSNANLNRKMVA